MNADSKTIYDFENTDNVVSIARNLSCSFIFKDRKITSLANVNIDLKSDGGVTIEIPCNISEITPISIPDNEIKEITLNSHVIRGFVSGIKPVSSGLHLVFSPNNEPMQVMGDDSTKLSKVVFHLFNFKDSRGTEHKIIECETGKIHQSLTRLVSSEWTIELVRYSPRKKEGNGKPHHLTHIGYLSKNDDSLFEGKIADEMLTNLHWFFTFSQASFCSPVLPIGLDHEGKIAWSMADTPRKSISGEISWFDPHHSEELAQLFPNFLSISDDEKWGDTLHHAIYWYARSNNSLGAGIDSGIILTQVAIERLGYEYAVNQRRLIESKGFKDLKASDKFRLLFSSLDLPIDISDRTPKIKTVAEKFGYIDNPHFLTEVRNSLVHPEHKRQKDFSSLYYDTWRLGLWYLELAILKICEYHGTYVNRLTDGLWVGQVENVPWDKGKDREDS